MILQEENCLVKCQHIPSLSASCETQHVPSRSRKCDSSVPESVRGNACFDALCKETFLFRALFLLPTGKNGILEEGSVQNVPQLEHDDKHHMSYVPKHSPKTCGRTAGSLVDISGLPGKATPVPSAAVLGVQAVDLNGDSAQLLHFDKADRVVGVCTGDLRRPTP